MNSFIKELPVLLDCTLRDGSYAVGFQFTRRDTARLCVALEDAGIEFIEIGHGMGLGASSPRHGIAFESDEDYMAAAAEALKTASWGVFFIPGIGTREDLRKAVDYGVGFVRFGSEVEDFRLIRPFAEMAKDAGVTVCANLMKTYAVPPAEIGKVSSEIESWGSVDCLYVVDSAGCMLPTEVGEYVSRMRESTSLAVGFHGHNNLELGNANCLAAVSAGAHVLDGSIRGMGRSAGNAQTEVLAHLLYRDEDSSPIDIFSLFDAGEKVIEPLNASPQGLPPLDIVIGIAKFHTSHMKRFRKVADAHCLDLRRLILAVSKVDCVAPSDALLQETARDLARMELA